MSTLHSQWTALGIDVDDLERSVPMSRTSTLGRQATVAASSVDIPAEPEPSSERRVSLEDAVVEIGPVLGEGGMGVVRLARQLGLRREVAVKRLRDDEHSPVLRRALLREAWISGNLEHPNIVPVHALSFADDGPMLVMKRIEGTPLHELLEEDGAGDAALERWLEVLIQVCHSVHFAHDRGVLHLDIKPDNIMVGHFGEVYLLDWGVAASTGTSPLAWIPNASEIAAIVGTPGYMSPEQAAGEGKAFGEHTDVYLLGATLHHVVTGAPLHLGETLRETLELAYLSAPQIYPAEVPSELVGIIHKATSHEAEERYESADALRRALEDFRSHRSSRQLTAEALEQLGELRQLLGDEEEESRFELTAAGVEVEREIAACRYGFENALRVWPDNPDALAGKNELLRLLVRHNLRERDWRRAAAHLEELGEPAPELRKAVAELRAEIKRSDEKRAELEELERQMDLGTHQRTRSRVAFAAATTWLLWNFGCAYVHKSGLLVFDHQVLVLSAVATFVLYGVVMVFVRNTLLATRINRYAMLILWASLAGVLPLWLGAAQLGIAPLNAVALSLSGYLFFLVAMAVTVDKRVLWTVPVVSAGSAVSILEPWYAFEMNGLCGFVIAAALGWLWRSSEDELTPSADR